MREWFQADFLVSCAPPEMTLNKQNVENTWVNVLGWSEALWAAHQPDIRLLRIAAISLYEYAHTRSQIEDMLQDEFQHIFKDVSVDLGLYRDPSEEIETFGMLITAIPFDS